MNFITFSPSMCSIFPMANTVAGGQLVTEYNLKSRETVATDPNITYTIGPSYVHSLTDFEVKILQDSGGAIVNSYTLWIAEGRGVINGHFVETLAPMTIDLVEANMKLANQAKPILKGQLAIGIRTFFSTEQTMAGALLAENDEDMFLGIQLVVLPEDELVTPSESPDDESRVTCDLKLAKFTFLNNQIRDLVNFESKIEFLTADRIHNLDTLIDSKYITKYGLNSKKLYAFAGKGTDPATGLDTWEDVTDSMIVWDAEPRRTLSPTLYKQAQVLTTESSAYMLLPHKPVYGMTDDDGDPEYYEPRLMPLPMADYTNNTTGFVSKAYTSMIKSLAYTVSEYRSFPQGKQICYWETRLVGQDLPAVSAYWDYGDYMLVREDYTYGEETYSENGAPFTMYVIIPGQVYTVKFIAQVDGSGDNTAPEPPENLRGVELSYQMWYQETGVAKPETQYPEYYPSFFGEGDVVRGIPGDASTNEWMDYFRIRYFYEESPDHEYTDFYYAVLTAGPKEWSNSQCITGSIYMATEDTIGGFYNVSDTDTDKGYVILDSEGHLKLVDYEILRSGTLAYQLGGDITAKGSDIEEVQEYIDQFINNRVTFPTNEVHGGTSPLLNIYLQLDESMSGTIQIAGLDSRFNTAVELHVIGTATNSVRIDIVDCQKFKINSNIEGTPVINIFRTNLYYDPIVLQYIRTCARDTSVYGTYTGFTDLSLWYEKLYSDDPNILVNGMTVSEIDSPIIASDIDYWKEFNTAANDNNYLVALKSISFAPTGDITGCQVLVANNSTDNVQPGDKIVVGEFILPQGESLVYPIACLTRKLKVTGEFTSAYLSDNIWYVTDNSFSLLTGVYTESTTTATMNGTVAFHSKTTLIPSTLTQTSIDVWEPDSYHIFQGGSIT